MAAGEEGAGEVADGGDDVGEVVAAFPEAVVGGLVAEDLVDGGGDEYVEGMLGVSGGGGGERVTSISPTTIDRLGI